MGDFFDDDNECQRKSSLFLQCFYLKIGIPHSRVLRVLDTGPELIVEGVRSGVDANKVGERLTSLQPDRPVCVVQGFEEGGLQLG